MLVVALCEVSEKSFANAILDVDLRGMPMTGFNTLGLGVVVYK